MKEEWAGHALVTFKTAFGACIVGIN